MRSKAFSVAVVFVLVCGVLVGTALAGDYYGSGHFPTYDLKRKFQGTYSDSNGSYSTPSASAALTWSNNTDLTINYTSYADWHVLTNAAGYGGVNWYGQSSICSTNGYCDNSSAFNGTYDYCVIRLNTTRLAGSDQAHRKNTALHEFGHCWSLAHRWDADSAMWPNQTEIGTPNQRDIDLINARY